MQNLVLTEGYDFEEQFLEFNTDLWMENTRFMEKLDEVAGSGNFFEESVLHENVFKSAWEFIKKLVKRAKEWIIKTWNKFWDWLTAFFRSNKSFVQKYKNDFLKQVKELDSDFEMTVGMDLSKDLDFGLDKITDSSNEIYTSVRELEMVYGKEGYPVTDICNKLDDKLDAYKERYEEALSTTKISGNDISKYANMIIDRIDKGDKIIKDAKSTKDKVVKIFNSVETNKVIFKFGDRERLIKDSNGNIIGGTIRSGKEEGETSSPEKIKTIKRNISKSISVTSEMFTMYMTAIRKSIPVCRKIILKVIAAGHNAKYKKNTTKESTMFDFNYEDNVDFIF